MAEPQPVPTPEEIAILEKFGFQAGVAYAPVDEALAPIRLRLEPGDTLIVRLKRPVPREYLRTIHERVEDGLAAAGLQNKVLVLPEDYELVGAVAAELRMKGA